MNTNPMLNDPPEEHAHDISEFTLEDLDRKLDALLEDSYTRKTYIVDVEAGINF